MYDDVKPCDVLKPSEICIVVEQYVDGRMERKLHKHVPKFRISEEMRNSLLRGLVAHFSGIGPETIVHAHLNKRGSIPPRDNIFDITRHNYKAGVQRIYCGSNTLAWYEEIMFD